MNISLSLDFDFDFDFDSPSTLGSIDVRLDANDFVPRSPRSPISAAESPPLSPFDPSRFFRFPLDPPSNEASPVSPPLSPIVKSSIDKSFKENSNLTSPPPQPPPPRQPLSWIWVCHLCLSRYPLGVTRRCLVDGHRYCSGVGSSNDQRNVKRKKKSQACSSEFDYIGWQDWLCWRQKALAQNHKLYLGTSRGRAASTLRGCEDCEYPSQCRYKKMNQIPTVVPTASKKIRIKEDDSVSIAPARAAGKTAHDTEDEKQNETVVAAHTKPHTNEQEDLPAPPSTQTVDRKAEAMTEGEAKHDRDRSEKTTENVDVFETKRSRSSGGNRAQDKFGLKQSQILDFFRVARNL